jgi:hypothetical protein
MPYECVIKEADNVMLPEACLAGIPNVLRYCPRAVR